MVQQTAVANELIAESDLLRKRLIKLGISQQPRFNSLVSTTSASTDDEIRDSIAMFMRGYSNDATKVSALISRDSFSRQLEIIKRYNIDGSKISVPYVSRADVNKVIDDVMSDTMFRLNRALEKGDSQALASSIKAISENLVMVNIETNKAAMNSLTESYNDLVRENNKGLESDDDEYGYYVETSFHLAPNACDFCCAMAAIEHDNGMVFKKRKLHPNCRCIIGIDSKKTLIKLDEGQAAFEEAFWKAYQDGIANKPGELAKIARKIVSENN